jgi:3-deoxy-D-manno-octulosonic-acid transferase
MLRLIYTPLIYLLAPFALAVTAWRGIRDPAYRERLAERLGFTEARFDVPVIWVHAVSMGEVQAAAPLIRELRRRYPQIPLLMTTATPTGAERVRTLFAADVRHAYLPYDTPDAVNRFLKRVRPRIAIVMETEVWPNLFRACTRRRVPIIMASARLSEKSVRRLRWLGGLLRPMFATDITIAAQTTLDAERFIALGAERARVIVMGNVKFDLEIPEDTQLRGRALRQAHFPNRFVWVAGSTHEVEEQVLLDAHQDLRVRLPGALLVLVPRHPQRFAQVRQWLVSRGSACTIRSDGQEVADGNEVLLVDTMGELQMFYAAADVAFVGGTLVPVGGHNLLEPAALALPVLAGPHNFNAPDIAQLLFASGAARCVQSVRELSTALGELALNSAKRREMGAQGQQIVAANRGALAKVLALVEAAIGRSSRPQ